MSREEALALNEETITVTMNGHEASVIAQALAIYLELVQSDPVASCVLRDDLVALRGWIERIMPAVVAMAAQQCAAGRGETGDGSE